MNQILLFFKNLNEKIKQDLDIYKIKINNKKSILKKIIALIKIIKRSFLIKQSKLQTRKKDI